MYCMHYDCLVAEWTVRAQTLPVLGHTFGRVKSIRNRKFESQVWMKFFNSDPGDVLENFSISSGLQKLFIHLHFQWSLLPLANEDEMAAGNQPPMSPMVVRYSIWRGKLGSGLEATVSIIRNTVKMNTGKCTRNHFIQPEVYWFALHLRVCQPKPKWNATKPTPTLKYECNEFSITINVIIGPA